MTTDRPDRNPDPITEKPGSHPAGTGVGAAGGGVAGAALGALGGPLGALVGGAVGAVLGGAVGHGIAEEVDPTEEEAYWREQYRHREYVGEGDSFETWRPAYRFGWESRIRQPTKDWIHVEPQLQKDWRERRAADTIDWATARPAVQEAWERIDARYAEQFERGEAEYWREQHPGRPWVEGEADAYEAYAPAYRYGARARLRHRGEAFDEVEPELRRDWESHRGGTDVPWEKARHAVKDAWQRVEQKLP